MTKKNGTYFLSLLPSDGLSAGVWDPSAYRTPVQCETFAHFGRVEKVSNCSPRSPKPKYAPIEYRNIHCGIIPVFTLELANQRHAVNGSTVGEGILLFGTMRAYLGNVLVTPKAEWINETSPLVFSVKSEFVRITPTDGLLYFWWAYLQSPQFLQSLPVGSGGTRPRLDRDLLQRTPIEVPALSVREQIHGELIHYAERAWRDYTRAESMVHSLIESFHARHYAV